MTQHANPIAIRPLLAAKPKPSATHVWSITLPGRGTVLTDVATNRSAAQKAADAAWAALFVEPAAVTAGQP